MEEDSSILTITEKVEVMDFSQEVEAMTGIDSQITGGSSILVVEAIMTEVGSSIVEAIIMTGEGNRPTVEEDFSIARAITETVPIAEGEEFFSPVIQIGVEVTIPVEEAVASSVITPAEVITGEEAEVTSAVTPTREAARDFSAIILTKEGVVASLVIILITIEGEVSSITIQTIAMEEASSITTIIITILMGIMAGILCSIHPCIRILLKV